MCVVSAPEVDMVMPWTVLVECSRGFRPVDLATVILFTP